MEQALSQIVSEDYFYFVQPLQRKIFLYSCANKFDIYINIVCILICRNTF